MNHPFQGSFERDALDTKCFVISQLVQYTSCQISKGMNLWLTVHSQNRDTPACSTRTYIVSSNIFWYLFILSQPLVILWSSEKKKKLTNFLCLKMTNSGWYAPSLSKSLLGNSLIVCSFRVPSGNYVLLSSVENEIHFFMNPKCWLQIFGKCIDLSDSGDYMRQAITTTTTTKSNSSSKNI